MGERSTKPQRYLLSPAGRGLSAAILRASLFGDVCASRMAERVRGESRLSNSREGERGDGAPPPPNPKRDLDHAEPLLRVYQPRVPGQNPRVLRNALIA